MTVTVRLFARSRDLVGADVLHVQLPPGATVQHLRERLATDFPPLAVLLSRSSIAVANEYAEDSRILTGNDEVAVLPPVSGG